MSRRTARRALILAILSLGLPAVAQADMGLVGVGPRVGISSDPDQVVIGATFDLGEFAKNVRFQPSLELGLGDHTTTYQGNFMVSYYFPVRAKVTPYAGGSVSIAYYDFRSCRGFAVGFGGRFACDSNSTEIGPVAVGGIETKVSAGTRFLAELQIGFGDLPETKVVAGWR